MAAVNDSVRLKAAEIAAGLRKEGVSAETDLAGRALRKQFDYCNSRGIPYCVIAGPKELKDKQVVLRDMGTGKEEKVNLASLAGKLK